MSAARAYDDAAAKAKPRSRACQAERQQPPGARRALELGARHSGVPAARERQQRDGARGIGRALRLMTKPVYSAEGTATASAAPARLQPSWSSRRARKNAGTAASAKRTSVQERAPGTPRGRRRPAGGRERGAPGARARTRSRRRGRAGRLRRASATRPSGSARPRRPSAPRSAGRALPKREPAGEDDPGPGRAAATRG